MAGKLDQEARVTIKTLKGRGTSASSIARTLGVTEGAVRYHLRRQAARAVDGRAGKTHRAARWHEAIATWLAVRAGDAVSLAALHAWLDALATCGWIREKQTLLMQGPPGVGKTHLAAGFSVRAVECGFSVAFHRLEELIALLRTDAGVPSARLRRRKYMNVDTAPLPLPSFLKARYATGRR
jgi:hypothetical protein